jgi:hypothetical protein
VKAFVEPLINVMKHYSARHSLKQHDRYIPAHISDQGNTQPIEDAVQIMATCAQVLLDDARIEGRTIARLRWCQWLRKETTPRYQKRNASKRSSRY